MHNMRLLIIIPAYNEAENIIRVIDELKSNYPQYDYIVVNDGSSDETPQICRGKEYNLIDLPINLGLSGAFQTGMKYAFRNNYDCALQLDGDGQHDPKYIQRMIDKMENENLDIVIGSRYVDGKKKLSFRNMGNSLISSFIGLTTHKRIKDTTSGMRLYGKRIIKFYAHYANYNPEPDTIAYLIRCGAKVEEIQVDMRDRIAGESYFHITSVIKYMTNVCSSILFMQWFRRKEVL